MALAKVRLRREQEAYHQPDHLARCEVFSHVLVRLLGTDADELLEHISHLHVVDARRREVDPGEALDDLIEQVSFVHARDMLVEPEALHDVKDVCPRSRGCSGSGFCAISEGSLSSRSKLSLDVL